MRAFWEFWGEEVVTMSLIIGGVTLVCVLLLIGVTRVDNELSLPGELAKIEQLRSDVGRVASGANEDVIGQVTQWNQEIKSAKQYRTLWWGRAFTPKEWESVDIIELGEGQ